MSCVCNLIPVEVEFHMIHSCQLHNAHHKDRMSAAVYIKRSIEHLVMSPHTLGVELF